MEVKLNTDVILDGDDAYFPSAWDIDYVNRINCLKALVYFQRMEQIRPINVIEYVDDDGELVYYSSEFDCYFTPSECIMS